MSDDTNTGASDAAAFQKRLQDLQFEPTRVQGIVVEMFEKALQGDVRIGDPGTPTMKLIEMATMLSTAAIRNDEILDRKSYPFMALDEEDLFGHMSDKDYIDMYSVPGESTFTLYFSKSEIISRSIPMGGGATRKLTIPKHTRVTAGGIPFTMQYPIDFLVKRNGAVDVIFDLTDESPLQHLTTNKVEWEVIRVNGVNDEVGIMDILAIQVPIKQMLQTSYYTSISSGSVLKKRVKLINKFYSVRAYIKGGQGEWQEIRTTHSEQTFDILSPTLLLKVVDDELTYELPYIYLMGNLNGREMRVDVYTTNGQYDANLSEIDFNQFSVEFLDLDDDGNGVYTAPITILDTFDIRNAGYVTGGRDAPTFVNRREMVINNKIGEVKVPVSGGQIQTAITRLGFDSTLAIDDITRRTYIATRGYPSDSGSTSIDAGMVTLRSSLVALSEHPLVHTTGDRVILPPDLLYQVTDSGLQILDEETLSDLSRLDNETLVNTFNSNRYLWSPFHYVLTMQDNRFESSAYLLTLPTIRNTSFIGTNEESGLITMTSPNRSVTYHPGGYRIRLVSDSGSEFKEIADRDVAVQLMIEEGSVYGYINGTIVGRNENDHLIVEFEVGTRWNLMGDNIELLGFTMTNGSTLPVIVNLDAQFELLWSVREGSVHDAVKGSLDAKIGTHLLTGNYVGVYHEALNVRLGSRLSNLWTGARMVIGDRSPVRYTENVYLTYGPRDLSRYRIDYVTGLPEVRIVDGKNELIVEHEVGEQVLDATTGEPIILHHKGDIITTPDGEIEYQSDRYTQWWMDLALFDARYKYATAPSIRDYVEYISNLSVTWSNTTLEDLNKTALERTRIYFSPKNSIDEVTVIADDNEEIRIDPGQSLTVDLFVLTTVYQDYELRRSIEATVMEDVMVTIVKSVVSMSELEETIMAAMPEGVVGIKASGLGGRYDYRTITVLDGRSHLSINKEMWIDQDYSIGIRNDIRVVFRPHGAI